MELADGFLPMSIPVGRTVDRARAALGAEAFAAAFDLGARSGPGSTLELGEKLVS